MKPPASTEWHPIAHVAVDDAACRAAITETLHRRGWSVVEQPTGLHLLHAISGLILGDQPCLRPGLIVADAAARGCSGLSIARGLRDLGSRIPVVVVARAADELASMRDGPLTIVAPETAATTVELLARPRGGQRDHPSSRRHIRVQLPAAVARVARRRDLGHGGRDDGAQDAAVAPGAGPVLDLARRDLDVGRVRVS